MAFWKKKDDFKKRQCPSYLKMCLPALQPPPHSNSTPPTNGSSRGIVWTVTLHFSPLDRYHQGTHSGSSIIFDLWEYIYISTFSHTNHKAVCMVLKKIVQNPHYQINRVAHLEEFFLLSSKQCHWDREMIAQTLGKRALKVYICVMVVPIFWPKANACGL